MKAKTVISLLCVAGFIGCSLWSCGRLESLSDVPEIRFKSLVFEDKMHPERGITRYAVLKFSFIDGDGDIGMPLPSRCPVCGGVDFEITGRHFVCKNPGCRTNLLLPMSYIHYTWYKKMPDRTYEPFQFPSGVIADSTRIPWGSVMNKDEAHNKTLRGLIDVDIEAPKNPQGVDTMRIEFYIYDRARNKSNIDLTPDFSILNPPFEPLKK